MTSRSPASTRLPVIGLTGAVGAGKSTAAAALAGHACRVVDVDAMGHEALRDGPTRDAVSARFGKGVLDAGGDVERRTLASVVFSDRAALRDLEAIVHPRVAQMVSDALARPSAAGTRAVVVDCALLFEGGIDAFCDHVICVSANRATREDRAAATRGWSRDEFKRREGMQLPADEKAARACHVVTNDGDKAELERTVVHILEEVISGPPKCGRRRQ